MKNRKRKPALTFKAAVDNTSDIALCYQAGLQALGLDSAKIELGETTKCEGSVNIDTCVKSKYPNDHRWDYVFSYKSEAFFVEVHPAETGEVSVVLKKLQWLKDWLHSNAPLINSLKTTQTTPFFWIQSGKFKIPKASSQSRIVAQNGIRPISSLKLPK